MYQQSGGVHQVTAANTSLRGPISGVVWTLEAIVTSKSVDLMFAIRLWEASDRALQRTTSAGPRQCHLSRLRRSWDDTTDTLTQLHDSNDSLKYSIEHGEIVQFNFVGSISRLPTLFFGQGVWRDSGSINNPQSFVSRSTKDQC